MLLTVKKMLKPGSFSKASLYCVIVIIGLTNCRNLYADDEPKVTLLAGGDVEWSQIVRHPSVVHPQALKSSNNWLTKSLEKIGAWFGVEDQSFLIPYFVTDKSKAHIKEHYGFDIDNPKNHHIKAQKFSLDLDSSEKLGRYPFFKVASLFREASISFINLETPLSDRGRKRGAFRAPMSYAEGMAWAGIDVVSTANNHSMDAEEVGLIETMQALQQVDIGHVGTGNNLSQAREPYIVNREGVTFAFLAYTQFSNGGVNDFATPSRSGIAPMDPFLIEEDIKKLQDAVDFVVISLHWGKENSQESEPPQRRFAQNLIDAGADVIIGHHPHVPRGIEVYKGKVIMYSLGNLIFGHQHDYWMDNFLARIHFSKDTINQVDIIPVAGSGEDLAQPYPLQGEKAKTLLRNIKALSKSLDTELNITKNIGVINITSKKKASN